MANKKKSRKSNKKLREKLETKKLEQKIRNWLLEAMRKFRLTNWDLALEFIPDMEEDETLMQVENLSDYMKATVEVNLKACMEVSDLALRLACYHEIAHVLLSELMRLAKKRWVTKAQILSAEEKLCQILAHIVAGK